MGRRVAAEGDNPPEAAELDVRSPVIQVEGVEIFDKDRTELVVVNDVDRFVVEVDRQATEGETSEPHGNCEPPREPGTIAFLAFEPRLVLVSQFLGQDGRGHRRPGLFDSTKLWRGGIRSAIERLYRRRPDGGRRARGWGKEGRSEAGNGARPGEMGLGILGQVSSNAVPIDMRNGGSRGRRGPRRRAHERGVRRG